MFTTYLNVLAQHLFGKTDEKITKYSSPTPERPVTRPRFEKDTSQIQAKSAGDTPAPSTKRQRNLQVNDYRYIYSVYSMRRR